MTRPRPEIPEPGDEFPEKIAHLADELDASGADERVRDLEDGATELSRQSGLEVRPHYTPLDLSHARRITLSDGSVSWVEWGSEQS
jgi:hypothetical protein